MAAADEARAPATARPPEYTVTIGPSNTATMIVPKVGVQGRLFGPALSARIDDVFARFYLTEVFFVLGLLIFVASPALWSSRDVPDAVYFFGTLGVFNWSNMISSREPALLRLCVKRFDFWFIAVNAVLWAVGQSIAFSWDPRVVPIWAGLLPTALVTTSTDATNSSFEFGFRKYLVGICTAVFLVLIMLSHGSMYPNVSLVSVRFSMPGFAWSIVNDDGGKDNSTNTNTTTTDDLLGDNDDDARWHTSAIYSLNWRRLERRQRR
jgi:hypothetical protein